jgi:hypothetical protein
VYDTIKHLEYKKKRERKNLVYRLEITGVFLGIFVVLALVFYWIEVAKLIPRFSMGEIDVTRSVFILFSIIAIIFYRYRKWHIRGNPKLDIS